MKYGNMTREQLVKELGEAHELVVELQSQVSAMRKTLKDLQENEERIHILFSLTNDVMFSYDINLMVRSVSPNVERIIGYTPDELVGKYFYDLGILHPEDLNDALEDSLSALTGKVIHSTIYRFIAKDSSIKFGELSRIPLKRKGTVTELITVARDITERIERERMIREGRETAQVLLDASNDTSLLLDTAGNVIAVNEAAALRFGKSARELQGANIFQKMPGRTADQAHAALQEVMDRSAPVTIVANPLGKPLSITLFPIRDMQGNVTRIAANARDVTT